MYKKISKLPDFVFAILTYFLPIFLLFLFFSPDFYKREIISFGYLALISILYLFLSFSISLLWTKLRVVGFGFIFYYTIISIALIFILLTYNLTNSTLLIALRVIIVFIIILLIIPALIIKQKIENRIRKKIIKVVNKKK
ncbi:MAG3450 family membrane protein [Mesomycoplasma conjunctivae]|uniref:MAG3450 family membrane protein n=1 Tax=Mesomycoplasma conjunctivae TaxID=45361 RepID=UPI003DA354A0